MRHRIIMALLGLSILIPCGVPALAEAARYEITPGKPNEVTFESRAPLETVKGSTRDVRGWLVTDIEQVGDSAQFVVEVDLASLDTGIGLRDQHMRENHLHTDRFPKAIFRGGRILRPLSSPLSPEQTVELLVQGTFELHGVTRRIEVPVRVTPETDERGRTVLRIFSEFAVGLAQYEIPRPQFLVMKLDDIQRITLKLSAVEAGSDAGAAP